LKHSTSDSWLLLGDFNLIYKEEDKNNNWLNRRLMLRFRRALNHIDVKEVNLTGRRYTWSNGGGFIRPVHLVESYISFIRPPDSPLLNSNISPTLQDKQDAASLGAKATGIHQFSSNQSPTTTQK
jgi:hypothetical protein